MGSEAVIYMVFMCPDKIYILFTNCEFVYISGENIH